ncbi:unnamed protein product [Gordionus sp. m RMFG-2023]
MSQAVEPAECSIKVMCRFRPLNSSEERAGSTVIVKFPPNDETTCVVAGKYYIYDKVYKSNATQDRVYSESAKPIVKDVLCGYNGTIFAYGQTSSGKTHTMEGVIGDAGLEGIIPRIVSDIFQHIYQLDENLEFHIKVSYYEIYMDKIRDLLDVSKINLAVHEDKNRVPYVKGATERFVTSPEEVMDTIQEGKANRHVAVTNMNEHSSRSHSVFLINVKQENIETQKKLSGKLYLVDLAGSEKVSKTGAEGSVLDEAKNINKSLSALGNVIAALAEGTKSHVPYRDSKLTRILQESLGGNARTTIIICCSPASFNETETKSTLMFGQRAKTIKNTITINEELTAEEWKRRYERERDKVTRLKDKLTPALLELAKWRRGETVRPDEQLNLAEQILPQAPSKSEEIKVSGVEMEGERKKFEEEKYKLYQMLDEKDEDLTSQSQTIEELKSQLSELEETLLALKSEEETRITEISRLQSENDSARDEVKEVLSALEELALNIEQKKNEASDRSRENEALNGRLSEKLGELSTLQDQLQAINDNLEFYKKRVSELVSIDLLEIAVVLGKADDFKPSIELINGRTDEEFTVARLFINKLKLELEVIIKKTAEMELSNIENSSKIKENDKELSECKMLISQQEAKLKSLLEASHEMEIKKRQLEQQLDLVNEEYSKLKLESHSIPTLAINTSNLSNNISSPGSQPSAFSNNSSDSLLQANNEDLSNSVDVHLRQLSSLRDEISEKQRIIQELKNENVDIKTLLQALVTDHEKLKTELNNKSSKLEELCKQLERREQAKRDMKGLEETVAKELQTLHTLRKLFVQDLSNRINRKQLVNQRNSNINQSNALVDKDSIATNKDTPRNNESILADDEENEGANNHAVDKQKIIFLESNLDQLTRVHKQLLKDNADLRCEVPKLEKRMRMTGERVKSLEQSLRMAKETAANDRRRYQNEVERIKEAVRRRNKTGHFATIAKPIRAGHQPTK